MLLLCSAVMFMAVSWVLVAALVNIYPRQHVGICVSHMIQNEYVTSM